MSSLLRFVIMPDDTFFAIANELDALNVRLRALASASPPQEQDIQDQINAARPGDEIILEPSVHYGTLKIQDKPGIAIKARVPGETRISGLWKEADQGEVEWMSKWGAWAADHGDSHLVSSGDAFLFRYGGERPVDLLKSNTIEVAGKTYKKPPFGYAFHPEAQQIFVQLPDEADPNGKQIKFCDKPAQTLIDVQNSPDIMLDGIFIEGSGDTDAIKFDERSEAPTLRNCVFTHCRRAARLPHASTVEWCEYTYSGFWNFYQYLRGLNGEGTAALFNMAKHHWTAGSGNSMLEGGFAESIYPSGSRGCEFRYNFYHGTFDGFRMGAFVGTNSHHNVYWRNVDNHIEFESHESNRSTGGNYEHDSLLLDCPAAPVSHQDNSGGMVGEHWLAHCVIANREVAAPFMIKLMNVKNRIGYAHCDFELKAGHHEDWNDSNMLARGMKGQDVPSWLQIYNCMITGDQPQTMRGTPVIKNMAPARNTVAAIDLPDDWLAREHSFAGADRPGDLTDWPRPMRRVFDR